MSKSASATRGVAGWVKEDDLSLHTHVGVDKKDKTLYIKGNGIAYAKAWGGKKDLVYDTNKLSQYKGQAFKIHLTEKVGNNTWYRGMLDGKQVWLHSSYVESPQESKTSLLGHIISGDVDIYEKEINGKSIKAGSQYTNAVYYIKRQAKLDNDTYYLISKSPSDTKGVVGGVKESDLSIRTHVGVDKKSKTFYIKGNGKATTKAWGGKKDTVYGDLSGYINEPFKVHLTEKVGNNTWYRGTLGGKTVWLHSSYVYEATKSKTSLLGHIRSGKVQIYESIGGKSISAGSKYTNAVYYIKEEAKSGNDTYYLISKSPSATRGVAGWVKEDDLSLHTHVGVDKKDKTLYIKGNGIAYAKAWGGKKDLVYDTNKLSQYKGQAFKIHLTEKVGNNTWYRGMLDGKQVWLHSSYVESPQESKTSLLGHIISGDVDIYEKEINGKSIKAGSQYTNAVYYIKRQAKLDNDTYYLISKSPSDTKGVVGWVKESDLSIRTHVGVDKKSKTFYIKGNGKATTKAWGGKKDTVYGDLSGYINEPFKVHLTEKVGNNTWYRGTLGGKTVWLHSSYVYEATKSKTSLLGHIRSGKVQIYESIGGKSISAGSKYTNAVYYIKEEAKSGNDTYYLISKSPSATRGVVGWVKEDDLSLHTHVGVDKKDKTLYIKGNGIAYAKAWGGKKDLVYDTNKLSQYKGQAFKIHLTEIVGNNTWYRGMLDGKQVWLHSSYVEEPQGTKTSMLAHIVSGSVEIYETIGGKSFKAGATYTNAVYYIKLKRKVGNQEYYLISTSPSSVNGVVGWVKVEDLSYHDHVGVDKKAKTFYIKGNGKAYTKAWGGSKNLVYDLSNYKGELFNVHLTEKVGKNTWYRGKINGKGKTIWIHSNYLIPTSKVVVIDAGHGGIDTGARGNGLLEKNISLDLALRTQKRLESLGYTVIMTRTTDKTLKLEQRTKIANDSNADIFVSIHINAGGGTGIETWMQSNSYEGAKSFELAESIQNEVIKQTNVRDRGVKDGNLHVNRETKMPSSLIEVGFIDNKDDANKLKNESFKNLVVKGIVNGIKKYFQFNS